LEITPEKINISLLVNFIIENVSNANKNIRFFHFLGMEILDDSDLKNFYYEIIRHKIIFFTRNKENFENSKIMKVFKFQKKLGEV